MNARVLSSILKHLKSMPTFTKVGVKKYRMLLEVSSKAFKIDKTIKCLPFKIDNIEAEKITPEDVSSDKTILFLHGGGYIAGSINSHRDIASRIAKQSKAEVVIIHYRLAPEHPHPAGIEDALTAYKWMLSQNLLPDKIALVGDSAGGGLTLALLHRIKTNKLPMPSAAVLMSPWTDLENKNNSILEREDRDPMFTKDMLDQTAALYAGDQGANLASISPINNDMTDFCPMLIHVGENEILLDDSIILAKKAEKAGVKVSIEIYDEMFHVFQYFARYLSIARDSIEKIGKFIQQN
jgi:epsilon-lactone hydrolase